MPYFSVEFHLRWLERVLVGNLDVNDEGATSIASVNWSENGSLPVLEIVANEVCSHGF